MVLCLKLIARKWIGSIRHISIHQSFGNIHEYSSSWFCFSTALLIQITNIHQRPQRLVGEVGQLGLVTAGGVHHAAQGLVCRRLTSTAIPRTEGRRDDTQWKQSENLWSRTHYRRSMCIYIYMCVWYIYIYYMWYLYIYILLLLFLFIYLFMIYIYMCVIYTYIYMIYIILYIYHIYIYIW